MAANARRRRRGLHILRPAFLRKAGLIHSVAPPFSCVGAKSAPLQSADALRAPADFRPLPCSSFLLAASFARADGFQPFLRFAHSRLLGGKIKGVCASFIPASRRGELCSPAFAPRSFPPFGGACSARFCVSVAPACSEARSRAFSEKRVAGKTKTEDEAIFASSSFILSF